MKKLYCSDDPDSLLKPDLDPNPEKFENRIRIEAKNRGRKIINLSDEMNTTLRGGVKKNSGTFGWCPPPPPVVVKVPLFLWEIFFCLESPDTEK